MTQAFVYRWTELSTGKWYIGSHTSKGCHPDDGYICSSRIVKPLILSNPDNWSRVILAIGSPLDMRQLETELLINSNASHNPMSYNLTNGSIKFSRSRRPLSEQARKKISQAHRGRVSNRKGQRQPPEFVAAHRQRMLANPPRAMLGRHHTEEAKKKIAEYQRRPKSPETRARMSQAQSSNPTLGMLGKTHNEDTRTQMSESARNLPLKTCPHCGFESRGNAIYRYHFDRCKLASK